jgi:hypothetical protein
MSPFGAAESSAAADLYALPGAAANWKKGKGEGAPRLIWPGTSRQVRDLRCDAIEKT